MGRVKLPISRIVNNTNRQVTFSKRRNGILKKAYELAVLCDIDIALIMISPSGRISLFSGTRRIEDVMLQYFNFTDDENDHTDQDSEVVVNDRESVMSTLMRLKTEETGTQSSEVLSLQALEYRQEAIKLQQQLELARERLRVMEPDPQKFASLNDFDSCEERLSSALRLVEKRKSDLMRNECSSYQETVEQINTVVQYIINAQAEEKPSSIQNSEFGTWVDQNGHNGSDYVPLLFQNGMTGSTPPSQHADLAPPSALPIPKEEDGNHRIKTDY